MVAVVFGGSIVVELLRHWWGPVGTVRIVPPSVQKRAGAAAARRGAGAFDLHLSGAGDFLRSALHPRSRHSGADLCDAGMGTERGGRPRRPARPRLCRVLRGRRLFLRAAGDQFRPVVLDLPAARRHPCGVLGRDARLSGAAAARRLSRHRHAGVRRDHPARHHQLAEPDRRPQRRQRHSAPDLVRHSADARRGWPRRQARHRIFADPSHRVSVLPDPGAGAAHQLGDDPAAPAADRPRLGGAARGRSRLPRARHQHHDHQADGIRDRRHVRRLRRRLLRHPTGFHQPGILHLPGIGAGAGDRRARRHGFAARRCACRARP